MENSKAEIVQKLRELLNDQVEFAILFGSAKTGRLRPDSDIDIGVYLKKAPQNFAGKLELAEMFADHFRRQVDFVILNDSDIIITMQILQTGEVIINNNPELYYRYVMQKLSEYPDFKMSRRVIEENLLRGRIYHD